jgi:UPF0755 protein
MAERPPLTPVRRPRGPSPEQVRRRRIVAVGAVLVAVAAAVAAVAVAIPRTTHTTTKALPPPPPAPKPFRVIFPEGFTRAQMGARVGAVAKIARRKRHKPVALASRQYLLASRSATIPCFAPKRHKNLEGFLFPATYELKKGAKTATAKALVAQQLAAFKANYDKLSKTYARSKHLTGYDVLIIASMIEREAEVPKDRRLISAVIYNRLRDDIPLGIDATLRYRLNNWSRPLRESELQLSSAFNTRTHMGLPPTPIGSPGLASIKAALAPARVSYLYYVVKPGGHGAHAFSSTAAQFQRDVDAYNRARAANGGKDPAG